MNGGGLLRRSRKRSPPPQRRPSSSNPAHQERWWSVDDALREHARLVEWFATGDGVRGAYLAYDTHYGGDWPEELTAPEARWALAEEAARATGAALVDCHPI